MLVQQLELSAQRGPFQLLGAALLFSDTAETEGQGLYSYVLLANDSPDRETRQRYLRALATYVDADTLGDLDRFNRLAHVDQARVNVVHVPLAMAEPTTDDLNASIPVVLREATGFDGPIEDLLLEHYDFNRARQLLGRLPGTFTEGPYIVSYGSSLSGVAGELTDEYLLQDLSAARPPEIIDYWYKEFLFQAAQPAFWVDRPLRTFALRLRTTLERVAAVIEAPFRRDWVQVRERDPA